MHLIQKAHTSFELGKILGKGGFATVYHATCRTTGQQYALKKTTLRLNANSHLLCEDARRIIQEICLVSHAVLNADHVVNCYDAWCEFPLQQDYDYFLQTIAQCELYKESITADDRRSDCVNKTNINSSSTLPSLPSQKSHQPGRKLKLSFYILFELCASTLDEYMFGKLPPKKAIACVKEISDGMNFIHQQGIIHRDIKPSNLFISHDGKPKIGDFGLSIMLKGTPILECDSDMYSSSNSTSEPEEVTNFLNSDIVRTSRAFSESYCDYDKPDDAGSLPFFAPEQISHSKIDQKVDIYALGIVLYLMVVEFSTSHEKSLLISRLKEGMLDESFRLQNPELGDLILKMTSKSCEDRPAASIVGEKLSAICKAM